MGFSLVRLKSYQTLKFLFSGLKTPQAFRQSSPKSKSTILIFGTYKESDILGEKIVIFLAES